MLTSPWLDREREVFICLLALWTYTVQRAMLAMLIGFLTGASKVE